MGKHKKPGNNKQNKSQGKPSTKNSNAEEIPQSPEEKRTSNDEDNVIDSQPENLPDTQAKVSSDAPVFVEESKNAVTDSRNSGSSTDNAAVIESQRKRIEELETNLTESEENAENYEMKYNNLLEKISSMKLIFHNMKDVKSELAESKMKIEELETSLKEKEGKLKEKEEQIKEQMDRLKQNDDILKSQEKFLSENQEDKILIDNLNKNIQKYERQLKEINQMTDERFSSLETELKTKDTYIRTLNEQLEEYLVVINEDKSINNGLSDEINSLKNIMQQKDDEIKKINNEYATFKAETISNIDELVEKIHQLEAKNTDFKRELTLSNEKTDSLKLILSQSESQIEVLKQKVENTVRLEAEVKEKQLLIGKLRHEAIILNEHLTKALDIIKKNKEGNFVDKELISNLVLKFVSLPRGDSKKFEVLLLISSYLDWLNEEKIEAGLVYK